jgi:hypothetical protein
MQLTDLSDEEIVARFYALRLEGNRLLAQLIVLLIEMEDRRLHARSAFPTMFEFCTRRLGMSDAGAHRRTTAAKLVRRFPELLGKIERGEINLSTLVMIRDHLKSENFEALLADVAGKTTREIEELLARRAPRPDVAARLEKVAEQVPLAAAATTPLPAPEVPARVAPLGEERYALSLTVSRELRDKLARARDLMMHANPNGDLAVVLERAVDALLDKLEKRVLGKAERPRTERTPTKAGHVSRAARRETFERDGVQCTYVAPDGTRCCATSFLQIDHMRERARGGSDESHNLRVYCHAHNQLHAEESFGREHIELRRRKWDVDAAELARRALVHNGFRARDATRALAVVAERHANDTTAIPVEAILREALGVLT